MNCTTACEFCQEKCRKNTVRGEKCAGGAPYTGRRSFRGTTCARVRSYRGRFPRCAVFPSVASVGAVGTGAQLSWAASEVRSFSGRSFRGRRATGSAVSVGRRAHGYLTPRHRNETDGGGRRRPPSSSCNAAKQKQPPKAAVFIILLHRCGLSAQFTLQPQF